VDGMAPGEPGDEGGERWRRPEAGREQEVTPGGRPMVTHRRR
jgi:hypothetical protein